MSDIICLTFAIIVKTFEGTHYDIFRIATRHLLAKQCQEHSKVDRARSLLNHFFDIFLRRILAQRRQHLNKVIVVDKTIFVLINSCEGFLSIKMRNNADEINVPPMKSQAEAKTGHIKCENTRVCATYLVPKCKQLGKHKGQRDRWGDLSRYTPFNPSVLLLKVNAVRMQRLEGAQTAKVVRLRLAERSQYQGARKQSNGENLIKNMFCLL